MGVATGTFVLPNGSPVANGVYQWKLSGDAIQFGVPSCDVPRLFGGNLDTNGNMTSTFAFNDALSTTAGLSTTYQLTVKDSGGGQVWNESYYLTGTAANINLYPPGGTPAITVTSITLQTNGVLNSVQTLENLVAGANVVLSNSAGATTIAVSSTASLPSPAQIGDIPRYNVNGDGLWDAVNLAQNLEGIYAVNQTATLNMTGLYAQAVPITGNTADQYPTATSGSGKIITTSAASSTATVLGFSVGQNGSTSLMGMEAFYRWSCKLSIGITAASSRFWFGLGCYHSPGTGNNGASIVGTGAYATDTPNKSTLGFRYSSGTDTTWACVAITAGTSSGSATVVNTAVTPDTNIHLFEMAPNSAGTAITYFIDAVPVATVSTNLPPPANNNDSWASRFLTGDNKNTNTALTCTFYWMQTSFK